VTFLFGVLVGRDAPNGSAVAEAAANTQVAPDPVAAAPAEASAAVMSDPSGTPANKPAETLSYPDRLLQDAPAAENLKPAQAPPKTPPAEPAPSVQEPVAAAPPPPAPRPAPAAPPPTPTPALAVAAETPARSSDPSGPGFAVQVAAYRDRRESDTLAKQLIAKGYPAFVLDPVKGAPTALFRVRVGKYKTLKDAQAIMSRLQTAEQFNTAWIAR
jgi:cell division protein FtsN